MHRNKNVIEQILGSRANRDSEYCIFVIDDELNPLGGIVGEENPILFLPQVKGFIVQVKVEEGKYMPLCVCYESILAMKFWEPCDMAYGRHVRHGVLVWEI